MKYSSANIRERHFFFWIFRPWMRAFMFNEFPCIYVLILSDLNSFCVSLNLETVLTGLNDSHITSILKRTEVDSNTIWVIILAAYPKPRTICTHQWISRVNFIRPLIWHFSEIFGVYMNKCLSSHTPLNVKTIIISLHGFVFIWLEWWNSHEKHITKHKYSLEHQHPSTFINNNAEGLWLLMWYMSIPSNMSNALK